jgi:hypothetical protein
MVKNTFFIFYNQTFLYICWVDCEVFSQSDVSSHYMKNETHKEDELIERVKTQSEQLWNTIQEAKKSNLNVQVGFDDNLIKPYLKIFKELY